MDRSDDFRFRQNQQVIIAFKIGRPVGETLAAIIRFFQTVALDHRAHAAIQYQDPLAQLLL